MRSMASFSIHNVIVSVLFLTTIAHSQPLSRNFYRTRCPKLDLFLLEWSVADTVGMMPRVGASLLRLHFHDCFVNFTRNSQGHLCTSHEIAKSISCELHEILSQGNSGCDGSLLLDGQGREKSSVRNAGNDFEYQRALEVIDMMKEEVEEKCPGVVSCADLLAYAAQVSVMTRGGPTWPVLFGRRDSKTSASAANATAQLPSPDDNFGNLAALFARKGFSPREMIALSGAHTIGQSRCRHFRNRIYNESNINRASAMALRKICPKKPGVGDNNLADLDFLTPAEFNNDYFIDLLHRRGVLHSDQALFSGTATQSHDIVRHYAKNQTQFFTDFSNAMLKMSKIGVLTGKNGMIRRNCRSAR